MQFISTNKVCVSLQEAITQSKTLQQFVSTAFKESPPLHIFSKNNKINTKYSAFPGLC